MPDMLAASDGHIRAVRPNAAQWPATLADTPPPPRQARIATVRLAGAAAHPGHARRDAPEAIS